MLQGVLSPDCDVVGVVADGSEVAGAAARLQPVVVVVDLNLPGVSGLEACRRIVQAHLRARVILITASSDDALRSEAISAGASDFVQKRAAATDLVAAIRRAWANGL